MATSESEKNYLERYARQKARRDRILSRGAAKNPQMLTERYVRLQERLRDDERFQAMYQHYRNACSKVTFTRHVTVTFNRKVNNISLENRIVGRFNEEIIERLYGGWRHHGLHFFAVFEPYRYTYDPYDWHLHELISEPTDLRKPRFDPQLNSAVVIDLLIEDAIRSVYPRPKGDRQRKNLVCEVTVDPIYNQDGIEDYLLKGLRMSSLDHFEVDLRNSTTLALGTCRAPKLHE